MLKRFILWDFPRASWQYDVMVGIIVAFVLLTPRAWFRDQPRIPHASNIAVLPSEPNTSVLWVEPELLSGVPDEQRLTRLNQVLKDRTVTKNVVVTRIEPIYDSEREIKGYMAFAKP
jgi:hypothetical protein